ADAAERNIVSGNQVGIELFSVEAVDNVVAGNFIGTDASGLLPLGNTFAGIWNLGASSNRIGTNGDGLNDVAERNVISANPKGIEIQGGNLLVVAGNYIGTDASGTQSLGNDIGITILNEPSEGNRIGTNGDGIADEAEGNLISNGNGFAIHISDPRATRNVI